MRLHLATMCRTYNDYGSIRRDMAEGNLNSADFPEFTTEPCSILTPSSMGFETDQSDMLESKKAQLLWVANHERELMHAAFTKLMNEGLESYTERCLKLFVDVTDLFGQIYVVKDIGVAISNK